MGRKEAAGYIMKIRSAFSIQKDVIFALVMRDLKEKFSDYSLGNLWLILEPILLMGLMIVIIGNRGAGEYGLAEPPVFVLAGMVVFRQLWQPTVRQIMVSIKRMRPLKMFKQISLVDLMLSKAFLQAGIFFMVVFVLMSILAWLGYNPVPDNILMVLLGGFLTWIMAIGLGISFAVSQYYSPEFEKILTIIQMPLFILSAVIYPASALPQSYLKYLYFNPLVHSSEMIREYWIKDYISPVLDIKYLFFWAFCLLAFGLAAERLTRHKELPL